MVTRNEVFAVADKLLADKARPSVRRVRTGLRRGGSYGDIIPHLREWRAERGWKPKLRQTDVPQALQDVVADFATALWEAARQQAMAELQAERDDLVEQRARDTRIFDELAATLDGMEATVDRLTRENQALRTPDREGASVQQQARRKVGGAGRPGARAFWDRLAREAETILRQAGREMDSEEILRALPETMHREAEAYERLTPGLLTEKLNQRHGAGRYVRRTHPGTYEALPLPAAE